MSGTVTRTVALSTDNWFRVKVPVLSEQRMSMPAISSTADMRATMAPSCAWMSRMSSCARQRKLLPSSRDQRLAVTRITMPEFQRTRASL